MFNFITKSVEMKFSYNSISFIEKLYTQLLTINHSSGCFKLPLISDQTQQKLSTWFKKNQKTSTIYIQNLTYIILMIKHLQVHVFSFLFKLPSLFSLCIKHIIKTNSIISDTFQHRIINLRFCNEEYDDGHNNTWNA